MSIPVPAGAFGPGSERPFAQYFEGQASVPVASIDDVVAWLQTCEYVSDVELFQKRDFWQHPTVFEQSKRGDCEDFALWAWRKLRELGIDAEFCVGRVISTGRPDIAYAACLGRLSRGRRGLSLRAGRAKPFRHDSPARGCDGRVRPHFAVNHRFETNAFVGCAADSRTSANRDDPAFAVLRRHAR